MGRRHWKLGAWCLVCGVGCGDTTEEMTDSAVEPEATSTGVEPAGTTSTTGAQPGSSSSSAAGETSTPGEPSSTGATSADSSSGGDAPLPCEFFHDDFSSGDTSRSVNGFSWNNSSFAVSDAFGHGDQHALQFSFGPDASGEDSTSELRFTLGQQLDEIWLELYVYYPDGTEGLGSARYVHRDDVSSDNNKFLRLWSDDYDSRPKVGASTRPVDDPAGDSWLINEYNPVGSSMGNFGSGGAAWVTDRKAATCARGTWCQIRMHYVIADVGIDNGQARWWIDGQLVYENTQLPNAAESEADNFLDRGYLMGWANSGFTDLTYVYVDDVSFCDTDPGF